MAKSKDLFDDSVMSFGDHLEALRIHLFKALIGLAICVIGTLFIGDRLVAIVRSPIDKALQRHGRTEYQVVDDTAGFDSSKFWRKLIGLPIDVPEEEEESPGLTNTTPDPRDITVEVDKAELIRALKTSAPELLAEGAESPAASATPRKEASPSTETPPPNAKPADETSSAKPAQPETVKLRLRSRKFAQLNQLIKDQNKTVALSVQEPFITYLKVAFVSGLIIASPWVLYQMWLFVAAGLYPHERRYVYVFLPTSIGLFTGGAAFCFFAVFPFVLTFLLSFNSILNVQPQIRLSEWISFAIMLPVMFGLSFQLPLVMLFLERIQVFELQQYQEMRRLSILVIAIISMLLTPADPMSMLMMMIPLVVLYELGILMCQWSPSISPFDEESGGLADIR